MRGRRRREGVQDFCCLGIKDYDMAVLESKQRFGRECQKGLTRMLQEQIVMPQGLQGSSWPLPPERLMAIHQELLIRLCLMTHGLLEWICAPTESWI